MKAKETSSFFKALATVTLGLLGIPIIVVVTPLLMLMIAGAVYVAFVKALAVHVRDVRKAEQTSRAEWTRQAELSAKAPEKGWEN